MPGLADYMPQTDQPQVQPFGVTPDWSRSRPGPGAGARNFYGATQGAQAPNAYDLGRQFSAYYGGMPAHQIVSGMQEGQPPQGVGVATTPVSGPTPQPGQPGAPNAQGANGWSPNKEAGGESNNQQGITTPLGSAPPPPMSKPGGGLAPTGMPPQPKSGGPLAATGTPPAPPPPAALSPGPAKSSLASFMPKSASASGSEGPAGPPATVNINGQSFPVLRQPNAAVWQGMTSAQKTAWAKQHAWTAPAASPTPGAGSGTPSGTGTPGGATGGGTTTPPADQPAGAGAPPPQETGAPPNVPTKGLENLSVFYHVIGKDHLFQDGGGGGGVRHYDETASPAGNFDYIPGTGVLSGPGQFNDAGFTTKDGKFRTWDSLQSWANVDRSYFDPIAIIAARPDLLTGKDFYKYGLEVGDAAWQKLNALPNPASFHYTGGQTFSGTEIPTALYTQGVGDAGVNDLLIQAYKYAQNLQAATQAGDTTGAKDFGDKLKLSRVALAAYGVNYDPTPGNPETGTPAGEFDSRWNQDPYAPAASAVGNVGSNLSPDIQRIFGINGDSNTANRATAYEAQLNRWATDLGLQNQGKAAGLYKQGLDITRNDPSRARSEALAQSIADKPDPVDWETIRSQYVAGQDRGAREAADAASASFARRGVGGATGSAITGDIFRKAADDRALGVGGIDVAQSQAKRAGELKALDALRSVYGTYAGSEIQQLQGLGNLLMGQPPVPTNPAAGIGNAAVGLTQLSEAGKSTGPSPTQGALSGAVAGAGAGAALGPWGALAGALLGGASGYYNANKAA